MAKFINVPLDVLDGPKGAELSPSAKRLYVTSWVICDDDGNVKRELVDQVAERWGDAMKSPERVALGEILADMQRLGFVRELRKRGDRDQFKRCGEWLS